MALSTVLLAAAPLLGQAADCITTRKALAAGLVEGNKFMKPVVARPWAWIALKAVIGVWAAVTTVLLLNSSFLAGVIFSVVATVTGVGPAVHNVRLLRNVKK